jgi:hypothetical protein
MGDKRMGKNVRGDVYGAVIKPLNLTESSLWLFSNSDLISERKSAFTNFTMLAFMISCFNDRTI